MKLTSDNYDADGLAELLKMQQVLSLHLPKQMNVDCDATIKQLQKRCNVIRY